MKTIIITVLIGIALVFLASGCDSDLTAVEETPKNDTIITKCESTSIVLLNTGITEFVTYYTWEYRPMDDTDIIYIFRNGDGGIIKMYNTINIVSVIQVSNNK